MTYALFQTWVTAIGKDKIVGIIIDNARRVVRRVKPDGTLESFDERFTFDPALLALVVTENDICGLPFQTYTPVDLVQGVVAVVNAGDARALDRRYAVG